MENGAKVINGKYCYILTICLVLVFIFTCYRSGLTYKKPQESCSCKEDPNIEALRNISCQKPSQDVTLERMLYPMPEVTKPTRTDVMMVTPWLAPIVWNGTFDIDILNAQFHKRDVRIGLTVFALKKYTVFLENFIETAEKYFMVGHKVHYYVFTDRPQDIPSLSLAEGRTLDVTEVTSYKRWQDVTMRRMQIISENCLRRFIFEVDYLVCADVDMIFSDHVGVEILSDVFAAIHPGFFQANRKKFTNERRPRSHGFIPKDEGDYYYTGCYFGGTVEEVYKVASFCHNAMMADKVKKMEALWHDESYLNRYFLYYKPTKVLSPEYVWNNYYGSSVYVPSKRFVHVEKDYVRIRSN